MPILMSMLNLYKFHSQPQNLDHYNDQDSIIPNLALKKSLYNRGRSPDLEPVILKDTKCAFDYARKVIRDRWPEAEPRIMKDPYAALGYAETILKDRWYEAEPYIKQDDYAWDIYQQNFGLK
ncbi:MAG: hypothetical protein EO766_17260 [Hydrotalea sp. AMD]|uniref:hypothetical protein n=1 Tax=Hydrotalea sp. AMD TaxID=2501297 RepID=UPI0010286526|nr:hypothetical protein [Hydrotalea sp. AMD]RWZ84368.1 MAG: hypothetical protein EO766_17260 [Hydrotalea sp. AMD]